MACIENLSGLFVIFGGGCGCWVCCDVGGCIGPSIVLGCNSLFSDMYCVLSVWFCVWLGHGVGQFWLHTALQNNCVAMFSALISSLVGVLWYVLKSVVDIRFLPLGRVICLIVFILSVRSLCSNLRDIMGFRCGSSIVVLHSRSSSVLLR